MIETTVGRVILNEYVPKKWVISTNFDKKSLRDIIVKLSIRTVVIADTVAFLDDIKSLGYQMAFKGGLSFNLMMLIIPKKRRISSTRIC